MDSHLSDGNAVSDDAYLVVGDPIGHSRSPRIHQLFALQTGQRMSYTARQVPAGTLAGALREFAVAGVRGLNVTVPLKEEAWALAERRSAAAERAGAVNTLRFEPGGALFGDNTDGTGLVRDLVDNLGCRFAGRSLLLLGAGGAARGAVGPLLATGPHELLIANRTVARAVDLARSFADLGPISGGGFDELAGRQFDIVINATAASLHGAALPLPPTLEIDGAVAYDLMYAAEPTPFMRWALRHGAGAAHDGLGMLVEQAAEAFLLWRGVRPVTAPVIERLRSEL